MRVGLEKSYIDTFQSLVKDANKLIKKKPKLQDKAYRKALVSNNLSIEKKKQKLIKALHDIILHTFSINIKKPIKIEIVKQRASLIRELIDKIKSLNNYLEESFLKELKLIKEPLIIRAIRSKSPKLYLRKQSETLSKDYMARIEHTVFWLMKEIIFFDETLLKKYKQQELKEIKAEKLEIKDLEKILKTQSELLNALESKIPPPDKIKDKLFKKDTFNKWMPLTFAILASFESEHKKEQIIFSKLKKNSSLRKRIDTKIKHIVDEKARMLRIQEKRVFAMKKLGKLTQDHRKVFHEYVYATGL